MGDAEENTPHDLLNQARNSRAAGDLETAWSHVMSAKQAAGARSLPLIGMLEAELMFDFGKREVAEKCLLDVQDKHPDFFWAAFHLTSWAFRRGDLDLAAARLATARALDPNCDTKPLWRLRFDLATSLGQTKQVTALLEQMAERYPEDFWPHLNLGNQAMDQGDAEAAVIHYTNGMRIAPDQRALALKTAQALAKARRYDEAVTAYRDVIAKHGSEPHLIVTLAQIHLETGDTLAEAETLLEGVDVHPGASEIWQHICRHHISKLHPTKANEVLRGLKQRSDIKNSGEILAPFYLEMREFDDALTEMRAQEKTVSKPSQAIDRARALLGLRRYNLALRYLRFCLKRWPAAGGLMRLFVIWGLKLGCDDQVRSVMASVFDHLPKEIASEYSLLLSAFRNDLDLSIAAYHELQKGHHAKKHHHEMICKLIATEADFPQIGPLLENLGNPLQSTGQPLHRAGVAGMLLLEYQVDRQNLEHAGGYRSVEGWQHACPNSTLAALRVIEDWKHKTAAVPLSQDPKHAIPRHIYQYWHDAHPPNEIRDMVADWARIDGYDHTLLSRREAIQFLSEHYDETWVRAFRLAINPSEEADLIRLCILAKNGGLYADADDCFYGDSLSDALAPGHGLILYRETMGGMLGNNFMAAPPNHPVLDYAAQLACQELSTRSVELSWSKTGPGLVTRALAKYLSASPTEQSARTVSLLERGQIERCVAMHNPQSYKNAATHWENSGGRHQTDTLWAGLLDRLNTDKKAS